METSLPDNSFLEKLEQQLFQLPSYLESSIREDSWMTSSEIAKWSKTNHYGDFTPANIETFLLEKWKNNDLRNIRPAKYPHVRTMQRLWGHREKTYPGVTDLNFEKTDPEIELPKIELPAGAPKLFLSHSSNDYDLAVKMRQVLGEEFGVEAWLFEAELNQGTRIFEEIYLSICHCDALALLLTVNSLGSAWVDSELRMSSEMLHKKIITIIDGDDEDLMFIIDQLEKDCYIIVPGLVEKFKKKEASAHRVARFEQNAYRILSYLQGDNGIVKTIFPPRENVAAKYVTMSKALENLKQGLNASYES